MHVCSKAAPAALSLSLSLSTFIHMYIYIYILSEPLISYPHNAVCWGMRKSVDRSSRPPTSSCPNTQRCGRFAYLGRPGRHLRRIRLTRGGLGGFFERGRGPCPKFQNVKIQKINTQKFPNCNISNVQMFNIPKFNKNPEFHFCFYIFPPNSRSTAPAAAMLYFTYI